MEAVEAGGRGTNNPRRRNAGGGGGRGAQTGDQELVREAVLKAAFARERGRLNGEHVFVACCGGGYGVEDNLRRRAMAGVPVGQDSGERN